MTLGNLVQIMSVCSGACEPGECVYACVEVAGRERGGSAGWALGRRCFLPGRRRRDLHHRPAVCVPSEGRGGGDSDLHQ